MNHTRRPPDRGRSVLIEKEKPMSLRRLHPVEDHPARRPVPAGHRRPAGGHLAHQARRNAEQVFQANTELLDRSARQRLQAHGETQALRIQRYFMDAYQYGNGFARLVQALKARGGADLRNQLNHEARAALAGNPDLIGLYLVFQPNALDQRDSPVRRPGRCRQQRQRALLAVLVAKQPRRAGTEAMPESMLADTSIGANGSPYNRWLTCPLEPPRPACSTVLRRDQRPEGADDQHRPAAARRRQGGRRDRPGHRPGQPAAAEPWPGARNCSTARAR
jgi:hypothetical protein